MASGQNTLRATFAVSVTLLMAFAVTGFASAAYHRKQVALGVYHYNHGRWLQANGELNSALEEYRKALLFSPDKTEYRISLATALVEAGRLDEAESHLEELLQEDPTNGRINLLFGRVAVQRHNLKQAVDYYQRAVYEYWPDSELPERRQARWELANLMSQTGNRSGFVAELMQLYTNLPPGDTGQKFKVGMLLLTNGATSEAYRIFQDLVRAGPQNGEAHRGLGEVYFGSGDFVLARHEFQKALRIAPKDQKAAAMLVLTNDVIDLDAALPYISSAEQFRRSKNLLTRVIKQLEPCAPRIPTPQGGGNPGSNPPAQRLEDAKSLLAGKRKTDDAALAMQRAAGQLWADKAVFCGKAAPQDRALDTVFARIGHE